MRSRPRSVRIDAQNSFDATRRRRPDSAVSMARRACHRAVSTDPIHGQFPASNRPLESSEAAVVGIFANVSASALVTFAAVRDSPAAEAGHALKEILAAAAAERHGHA